MERRWKLKREVRGAIVFVLPLPDGVVVADGVGHGNKDGAAAEGQPSKPRH